MRTLKVRYMQICALYVLVFAFIMGTWGCSSRSGTTYIVPESRFYTLEELKNLYLQNKEEFKSIAEIVLASEGLYQQIEKEGDADAGVYVMGDKQFFSNTDWERIVAFNQKIKVYMIMRSIKGGQDIVYFHFVSDYEQSTQVFVTLYYFPEEAAKNLYVVEAAPNSIYTYAEYMEIEPGWWVSEVCIKR